MTPPPPSASDDPLAVSLAGIELRNPVVLAAGTCGYVDEIADVLDPHAVGAVVTKSVTAEPRIGNRPWRILDERAGMLNAIGLANVGLERFLAEHLPRAARCGTTVIGSIAGHGIADYVTVARRFDDAQALPAVELNVSCPNTADGLVFGERPEALAALLDEVRPVLARTRLVVKLSPNVGSIAEVALAAVEHGADALGLINTVAALAIDVETRRPRLARGTGGLSGPAIHPVAVRMIRETRLALDDAGRADVPIVGYGGVFTWEDAAEFVLAGATAVGMGTALFVDPRAPRRVVAGLRRWLERQHDATRITDLVGAVRDPT